MKRLIALLLVAAMCVGLLCACAQASPQKAETPNSENGSAPQKTEEPAHLRIVMHGDAGARNTEFYENEFAAKILEELNITMEIEYVPWGQQAQVETMLAAGEPICYMAMVDQQPGWIQKGYYTPFDETKINELMPNYLKARDGIGYECVSMNGEILALPVGSMTYGSQQCGIMVRNDLLNAVGLDYTDIKSPADIEAAAAAVKEKFPDITVFPGGTKCWLTTFAPDEAISLGYLGYDMIVCDDESKPDSDQIVSWYESEAFANFCRGRREWYLKGWITENDIVDSKYFNSQWNAGNSLFRYGETLRLYDHALAGVEGADVRYINYCDYSIITRNYDWGWAVSPAAADNIEDYMRFFDWLYASEENYLFCLYGVEGKDWERDENGAIVKLTPDLFFYEWQHGASLYRDFSAYDPDEVAEYLAFDEKSIVSKSVGFIFDNSAVQNELAMINAVVTEYVKPFEMGVKDYDSEWPETLQKLKDAGLDTYVAEYQRQFSEWWAANK